MTFRPTVTVPYCQQTPGTCLYDFVRIALLLLRDLISLSFYTAGEQPSKENKIFGLVLAPIDGE